MPARSLRHVAFVLLCLLTGLSTAVQAQQILIDKPVKAGELILFPDLNDQTAYYYVSDKPHLAVGPTGAPQFSFLRYVENVRSGADQPEAREGEGGGIVHAVVALSVTPQQLADARRELQRVKPGARIEGPVVFRAGKFGLVTSFKDPAGKLSTQVVGLGNAPLLDGEKAAVSMQLTKLGSKLLWESFQTPTPDISFTFEMDVEGFRSPHRGLIEANFDQIYEHQAFGAGIASSFLAAEIKVAFDDLQRQGAIKVTQVGADEKLEGLLTTAYNKLTEMMFSPLGGTGTPSLDGLTGMAGGQAGLLDRASTMYAKNRDEARTDNERIRRENREEQERRRAAGGGGAPAERPATPAGGDTPATPATGEAREGAEAPVPLAARQKGFKGATRAARPEGGGDDAPKLQEEVAAPAFAVVAAFEMKKVRQRGTFRIDLNKFTSDKLTLRFDENIGDLRNLMGEAGHFRQVNLDDPLYRQRELVVFVDGTNARDFGQYINFVTVRMRKRHAGGEETNDEVRIDRTNFSKEGNAFKLLYGWKGDTDRRRWMDYEYQPVWSFFGGQTVEGAWRSSSAGAINLAPPYQRRTVELQADGAAVQKAEIRAINVKLFYKLGEAEQVKQVTLNAGKSPLADKIEFMAPADRPDYEYEITWRLTGNRTVTSGRKTASEAILFVDELPKGTGDEQ